MPQPTRVRLYALLLLAAVAALVVVPPLAGMGDLVGARSRALPTLFRPAGYTFAIWGVIYALLAGLGGYGLVARADDARLDRLGPWPALLAAGSLAWIAAFTGGHDRTALAVMAALVAGAVAANARLGFGARLLDGAPADRTAARTLALALPVRMLLGWLTVAACANATHTLAAVGIVEPFGVLPLAWAHGLIVTAMLLGLTVTLLAPSATFAAVVAWGLVGVAVEYGRWSVLRSTAAFVALLLVVAGALVLWRAWREGEVLRGV